MAAAQVMVVALLLAWGRPSHAGIVAALLVGQLVMMRRLLQRPAELDVWYNACGVPLYVLGMLVSAFALRPGA
jgi:chlorophyll synthase